MTVVRGVIREIGRTTSTQIGVHKWYSTTTIVVQDEDSGETYDVRLTPRVMEQFRFLPRVGIRVVVHGHVEKAEYGLSDYVVTHVTRIRHEGADILGVTRFDDEDVISP